MAVSSVSPLLLRNRGEGQMQSFSFDKIMWQKGIKPPPLSCPVTLRGVLQRKI